MLPTTANDQFTSQFISKRADNQYSITIRPVPQTNVSVIKCQTHGLWQFLFNPSQYIYPSNSKPIVTSIFINHPPLPDQIHPQTPIQSLHDISRLHSQHPHFQLSAPDLINSQIILTHPFNQSATFDSEPQSSNDQIPVISISARSTPIPTLTHLQPHSDSQHPQFNNRQPDLNHNHQPIPVISIPSLKAPPFPTLIRTYNPHSNSHQIKTPYNTIPTAC